ncbi:hypothetical protein NPIL_623371 [Nephila pilipes]|uniref:Uncharacterized protein n=1 Tax=Nephila pilipes TaxID=299642 RepID=A0A8X6NTF2_NEPPI|nr:hypothetical protein NPIL_623371 [Nephila pilipes]
MGGILLIIMKEYLKMVGWHLLVYIAGSCASEHEDPSQYQCRIRVAQSTPTSVLEECVFDAMWVEIPALVYERLPVKQDGFDELYGE